MPLRPALLTVLPLALALLLPPLHARAAEPALGVLTIVEGEAAVLRDAREFIAAEGQQLRSEDIVRSRDGARLTRIELQDGTLLDIGPATELLLQPRAFAAPAELGTSLYLLRGWLKVTTGKAAGVALATPQLGVARVAGSVVVHATAKASLVFLESGRAEVLDRGAGQPDAAHALADGDSFAVRSGTPGTVLRRPPADLIEGLPRAFADSLPRRAAQWRGRVVEPGLPAEPGYADLEPWLHAEPALRGAFVKRFAVLAKEPPFRAALLADLRAHPEWTRVLFPDRYGTRATSTARRSTTAATTTALAQAPRTTDTP